MSIMKRKQGMDFGGVDDVKALRGELLTPPTPPPLNQFLLAKRW